MSNPEHRAHDAHQQLTDRDRSEEAFERKWIARAAQDDDDDGEDEDEDESLDEFDRETAAEGEGPDA